MAELIIGMGHQKSLLGFMKIIEEQLVHSQGVPRRILAHGDDTELIADRNDYKDEFNTFVLRVRTTPETARVLRASSSEYAEFCDIHEEGGWEIVHCPRSGLPADQHSKEAIEKLFGSISMPEVWRVRGENYRVDKISIELLFQAMIQYKASDVHLAAGATAVFRVDGQTLHSDIIGTVSTVQIRAMIRQIAADQYWDEFERTKQTSFNFHQIGLGYSRVSAFMKAGAPHCTLRFLPEVIPSFEDLSIPRDTMVRLANLHHGLVLVTGMTGSGKTTTSAALLDYINSNKTVHIITIENPVEYVHLNKRSLVSQRSLGADVNSFNDAVTGALRHDPDVIFIGEMRDPDTIRAAISAAATGHLVVSTLHANTASEVVNRVVSFFDPVERDLVKLQLRDCVRCIICQRLVPKIGGGRVPSLEILFNDIKAINDGILEGDTDAIRVGMQQTVSHSFIFEDYLHRLYKGGKIDLEQAQKFSTDQSIFDQMLMGTYSVPRLDSLKALRDGGGKS